MCGSFTDRAEDITPQRPCSQGVRDGGGAMFLTFLLNCQATVSDPQGTLLNTWKPVWVVLSEDAVEFYKKKTDRSPKGMIPLKGATLLSPCQDFGKRLVSRKYGYTYPGY